MGEFDPPEAVPYNSIPDSELLSPAHTALARQAGRESVVLLKNTPQTLPLDASRLNTVAVLGPRANEVERDWYAGYLPYRVTPLTGIGRRAGSVAVLFDEGTSRIALRAQSNQRWVTVTNSALTNGAQSSGTKSQQ